MSGDGSDGDGAAARRRLGGSATWVAAGWAAAATVATVAAATATTVAEARAEAEAVATAAVARAAMEEEEAANAPSLWRDHREGRVQCYIFTGKNVVITTF